MDEIRKRFRFPTPKTDEQEDTTDRDILLQEVMDAISERRAKFNGYLSSFIFGDQLNQISKEIAEAYLTGIDDANRIVKWFKGEGARPEKPTFVKAKLNDVSNYGIQNDPELWKHMYGNEGSEERGAEMAPALAAAAKAKQAVQPALPPAVEVTIVEETYIDVEYREIIEIRCSGCNKELPEGQGHPTEDPNCKHCDECAEIARNFWGPKGLDK